MRPYVGIDLFRHFISRAKGIEPDPGKRKKGSTYKNEISGGKIEATKKPAKASC